MSSRNRSAEISVEAALLHGSAQNRKMNSQSQNSVLPALVRPPDLAGRAR